MPLVLILIASFIPSVIVWRWLRRLGDEDHAKTCDKVMYRGWLSPIVVFLVAGAFSILGNVSGLTKISEVAKIAYTAFVLHAFAEELVKMLNTTGVAKEKKQTVSRLQYMIYAGIAALGFGMAENIVHVFFASVGQMIVGGLLMGHLPYGLMMGWFLGKAAMTGSTGDRILALGLPWFFHGLYDFSLDMADYNDIFAMIAVCVTIFTTVYMIVMLVKLNKWKNDPEFTKPVYAAEEEPSDAL